MKLLEKIKVLHDQHKKYVPAIFFSCGFILDIITLGEIDDLSNIIILGSYLFFVIMILSLEYLDEQLLRLQDQSKRYKVLKYFLEYRKDIFHFLLGALLSAFTLFYFKSSSFANSFIFMLIMLSLLVLNELDFFKKQGIVIHTGLTMLCLVSYIVYLIPILIGQANSLVFYFCATLAIFTSISAYILLNRINLNPIKNRKELLFPQLLVLIVYISLYSLKILPPIPLSIKYVGIFHDVSKSNNNYTTKDLKSWWEFWNNGDEDFHARDGDKVFVFVNIFSPGGFAGKVYLRWLKNSGTGLITSDRIPLNITGGRTKGFRGYAYKKNYTPGEWQVSIETEDALVIGSINFTITTDNTISKRKFNIVNRN